MVRFCRLEGLCAAASSRSKSSRKFVMHLFAHGSQINCPRMGCGYFILHALQKSNGWFSSSLISFSPGLCIPGQSECGSKRMLTESSLEGGFLPSSLARLILASNSSCRILLFNLFTTKQCSAYHLSRSCFASKVA